MDIQDKFNEFQNAELIESCLICKKELNFNEIAESEFCFKCEKLYSMVKDKISKTDYRHYATCRKSLNYCDLCSRIFSNV